MVRRLQSKPTKPEHVGLSLLGILVMVSVYSNTDPLNAIFNSVIQIMVSVLKVWLTPTFHCDCRTPRFFLAFVKYLMGN